MKEPGTEIWARPLPRESRQAYEAFARYRDLGAGRTLVAVGRGLGKSHTLLSRWSARWAWVERVQAYDIHLDVRQREENERRILAAREQHYQMATDLLSLAQRRLLAMDPAELPAQHLVDLISKASEQQLRALGVRGDGYDDPAALDNIEIEIVIVDPDTGERRDWQG